ncbi:hypothetical protein Tco_0606456, partial [Tanacetum coccineum]
MTGAKFNEKFDGTGDFRLWRINIRVLLIQHECKAVLEVLPMDVEAEAKAEINKKAHSAVILCLGNKVLREVIEEMITAGVWSKLDTLYMTKSLDNKLYLKKKLYTFYMPAGRKFSEHIDEFNKIVLDLANIEEALTLEDVMATLNSKKIKERSRRRGVMVKGYIGSARLDHEFKRFIPHDIEGVQDQRAVLSRTRRDNCVYSFDGHALAGELNASVEEKDSLAQVWHKKLRHISEAGLQVLEKQELFGKKSI